ncbi:hypothetical protein AYO20_08287 [Fonsecaea nubica]|uniref:Uncharacterized protein n=1 Tax=Fonsecaea nubica TaxID=856822 RepID=A0A178CQ04_9EURO|nr:hypothetical protein AYO20_08287 [Fonsecaea nubica]OAL31232.1 hypothetical protein AYO20_08287 [Fonsecaea nubica]
MPFGTIKTSEFSKNIPIHSLPYFIQRCKVLLPEEFEIEDEPVAKAVLLRYGMARTGAYHEFIHQIEVKFQGKVYDYAVSLILDNEAAIYGGREEVWYSQNLCPKLGEPPSIREFIPIYMDFERGEVWTGEGSLAYSGFSDFDPLHKLPVLRYESATLVRRAEARMRPVTEVFKV